MDKIVFFVNDIEFSTPRSHLEELSLEFLESVESDSRIVINEIFDSKVISLFGYNICNEEYSFTNKQAISLVYLFEQYKLNILMNSLLEYINKNLSVQECIKGYFKLANIGLISNFVEQFISKELHQILFNSLFAKYPTDCLLRILEMGFDTRINHSAKFAFVLKSLSIVGMKAEPLLSCVDFDQLTIPQLYDLKKQLLNTGMASTCHLLVEYLKMRHFVENTNDNRQLEKLEYPHIPGDDFLGIIHALEHLRNQNPYISGLIELQSSSHSLPLILTPNDADDYIWVSNRETSPMIQIDFPNNVQFNSYVVKGGKKHFPMRWKLLGSQDRNKWSVIDEISVDVKTENSGDDKVFKRSVSQQNVRSVRFVQKGIHNDIKQRMYLTNLIFKQDDMQLINEENKETINVISSSCDIASVINPKSNQFWHSKDERNSYYELSFNHYTVCATTYTIQTYDYPENMNHLKSWSLFGSLDKKEWVVLDVQENNVDLNGPLMYHCYNIKTVRPFKHFRILQTGPNHKGKNILVLESFELFGLVLPD